MKPETQNETTEILALIKKTRKAQKKTQADVSAWLGLERSTYVRKEAGAIPMTINQMFVLLQGLGLIDAFKKDLDDARKSSINNNLQIIDNAVSAIRINVHNQ